MATHLRYHRSVQDLHDYYAEKRHLPEMSELFDRSSTAARDESASEQSEKRGMEVMKRTPQEVADVMGPSVAQMLCDQTRTTPQVVMFHEEGIVKVMSQTGNRDMVSTDVRFCCIPHCWEDIETQAAAALSGYYGITIIEVVPPSSSEWKQFANRMLETLLRDIKRKRRKKNKE